LAGIHHAPAEGVALLREDVFSEGSPPDGIIQISTSIIAFLKTIEVYNN
jgi:hypothetical protein